MTDAQYQPLRHTTSPDVKKTAKKSHRPALLTRRISARGSTPKAVPEAGAQRATDVGKPDMAASFLQYCAMCERQIVVPNNSILYCSEACRRKDSCKPLSLSASAMTPTTTPPNSRPGSPRPILPPCTPTGVSTSFTSTPSLRIPTDIHNAKSDLDPTEWKPKLHRRGASATSEAFRYLSQFHLSSSNIRGEMSSENDEKSVERASLAHRSTTSVASMTTPSLVNTPTTAASSLSTSASAYDFNTRPLPPRQNPFYSASAGATKGIELVMPHVAPPIMPVVGSVPESSIHGGVWEKKTVTKKSPSPREGLGALFGTDTSK